MLAYIFRVLLLTFFIVSPIIAQAETVDCKKTIKVSAANDWPPYSWEVDGKYYGIDISIVEFLLEEMNYCWQYEAYPSSSRAFREFKKGNIDLIFAASYASDRTDFAVYSTAYRREEMKLVFHASNQAPTLYSGESVIAVNRGSYYGQKFERFRAECPECIVDANQAITRLQMVNKKRVAYAIEDAASIDFLAATNDLTNIRVAENTVNVNDVHFMLRPGFFSDLEVERFNTTINLHSNKLYSIVKGQYSPKPKATD